MIDIEPIIFDAIYTALPNVTVLGSEQETPESFPCVTVVEQDNRTYTDSLDESLSEHHANISYVINVYSTVSKTEAKNIAKTIDGIMLGYRFTRSMFSPTANIDRTIHRYTARYDAVVGADYHMYRG